MSINSLPNNTAILRELGTALAPYLDVSGISSLVGDSNISCDISGTQGNVHLDPSINVENIVCTNSATVTGLQLTSMDKFLPDDGTEGQALTTNGAGQYQWNTVSTPTAGLLKNIFVTTLQSVPVAGTSIVIFNNSGEAITGCTVGKVSVLEFDITFTATATIAAYFNIKLLVDGNEATPPFIVSYFATSGDQSRGVKFLYTNTSESQTVSLSLEQSTSIVSPAIVAFGVSETFYTCLNWYEIE